MVLPYHLLCLILVLKCAAFEIPQRIIDSRRLELVRFKAFQWGPVLSHFNESLSKALAEPHCRADVYRFLGAMLSREPAGLRLLDSLGSPPTGILKGSMLEFGSHELCFEAGVRNRTGAEIGTKFCHYFIYQPANVPTPPVSPRMQLGVRKFAFEQSTLKLGGCFPSSCADEHIKSILDSGLAKWKLTSYVSLCDHNEPWQGPPPFVTRFLAVFVAAVGLATLLDIYKHMTAAFGEKAAELETSGCPLEKLRALSAVGSFRAIFSLPARSSNMDAFHGLRVLATVWVITIHTHIYVDKPLFDNIDELYRMSATWMRQFIVNASMSVCMFFTIGSVLNFVQSRKGDPRGFMLWLTLSKRYDKDPNNISLLSVALHRYFRLFPIFLIIQCFHQLVPTSGYGPYWAHYANMRAKAFPNNWPHYFMGTFNFLEFERISCPQHWYSGVDFQLFVFSLYFVLQLKRTGKTRVLVLLAVASMTAVYTVCTLKSLKPGVFYFTPIIPSEMGEGLESIYYTPYVHFGSYCIGILTGFYYSTHGAQQISKGTQAFLWLASFLGMAGALFGSILWNFNEVPSAGFAAFYKATHRVLFSAGTSWLIFACVTGRAGFVNSVLSWPVWAPLSRLSFGAYMIHDFIVFYQWLSFRNRISEGYFSMMTLVAGNCVTAFAASFLLHAIFEKPLALVATVVEEKLSQLWSGQWSQRVPVYGSDDETTQRNPRVRRGHSKKP